MNEYSQHRIVRELRMIADNHYFNKRTLMTAQRYAQCGHEEHISLQKRIDGIATAHDLEIIRELADAVYENAYSKNLLKAGADMESDIRLQAAYVRVAVEQLGHDCEVRDSLLAEGELDRCYTDTYERLAYLLKMRIWYEPKFIEVLRSHSKLNSARIIVPADDFVRIQTSLAVWEMAALLGEALSLN